MTKISQYSTDVNITGNDKWIGSDAQNYLITKNFTPNNLANYFNGNNVIDIGTSIRYKYQTLDPGEAREQGTISFETEIGPQVNFSAITTFLIAKNSLKQNDVSQYLDFLVDGKVLLSKASNINVFGYYKITSLQPWIPNTNFFVVTVDFLDGNGFIYEDLDYLISLVDKASGSGGSQDLQQVTDIGNTTTNDIQFINSAEAIFGANGGILLDNGSRLREGTIDAGLGGSKGIAQICAVGYELKWEAGRLYVMDGNGAYIRWSLYNFNITPTINDDVTKGYLNGSRWTLDNGDVYECTDDTTGAAVWELVNTGTTPTLQQVTDAGNTSTNDILILGANDYIGQISSQTIISYNTVTGVSAKLFVGTSGQLTLTNSTSAGILSVNNIVSSVVNLEFPNKPTGAYTIATTADLTLQQVLDNNHDLVDDNNFQGTQAGYLNTGTQVNAFGNLSANNNSGINVNAFGTQALAGNLANHVNGFGQEVGILNPWKNVNLFGYQAAADNHNQNVFSKWVSGTTRYLGRLSFNNITTDQKWELPNATGTLALTSNIGNWGALNYPTWTTGTPFVKMTAAGTFALDTNTYLTSAVTAVTATSPITSSGGNTPVISTSMATNKLIGRSTAGTGVMEEITVGTGLTLSGGTLNASATGGGIPHATAAGTDTYTATVTGVAAYADGDAYLIRFTNGNTTGATLNINSLGAIALYRNNDGPLIGGDIVSGGEMICVYNSTTTAFQCIGTAPNSLFAYVTNDDSVTLTKGMPVYAFSGTGDRMTVKRAYNTGDATSAQTVGLVLSTSIAANQKGLIMMQGLLDGLSILPTSTWADGDPVYLGATAGTITNIKPYAPNHLVYLGVVTTASNGAAGRLYVRVQNGYELQELHNVQAQSPSLNDTLWYDNTVSPAQWKTASIPTILGYTPANIASPTFTGTVTTPAIIVSSETASRVAIIDGSKNIKSADTATYPSLTELSYGKGVTSAIQTQIDTKQNKLKSFNRQTSSYTLALSDADKLVEMNVATANNLTIPLNSTVAYAVGTQIDIVQYGAGQTSIVATVGVTIRSTNSWLKINARYGAVTLTKVGTDEWYLWGNLNA